MLIALVGTLAFAAVWFTVLRPKSSTSETAAAPAAAEPAPSSDAVSGAAPSSAPASTPGVGVTKNVEKAQQAADTANGKIAADAAQANAVDGAAPATGQQADPSAQAASSAQGGAPATGSEPATKVVVDERVPAAERAVLRELADGKVVVMLFWDRKAADDRAARRAVRAATSGRKNVAVRIVPASQVGAYESITGGVTIERSPTTLVIGPQRKAVTISGLVDELEIEQAIARMAAKK
jgi:hypothetical protein